MEEILLFYQYSTEVIKSIKQLLVWLVFQCKSAFSLLDFLISTFLFKFKFI